jgi:hypothetical protein
VTEVVLRVCFYVRGVEGMWWGGGLGGKWG